MAEFDIDRIYVTGFHFSVCIAALIMRKLLVALVKYPKKADLKIIKDCCADTDSVSIFSTDDATESSWGFRVAMYEDYADLHCLLKDVEL